MYRATRIATSGQFLGPLNDKADKDIADKAGVLEGTAGAKVQESWLHREAAAFGGDGITKKGTDVAVR